jgi:hypothetical protein
MMSGADHERFARVLLPLRDEASDKRRALIEEWQTPSAHTRWLGWAMVFAIFAAAAALMIGG